DSPRPYGWTSSHATLTRRLSELFAEAVRHALIVGVRRAVFVLCRSRVRGDRPPPQALLDSLPRTEPASARPRPPRKRPAEGITNPGRACPRTRNLMW